MLQILNLTLCYDFFGSHLLMDETLLKNLILADKISLSAFHFLNQPLLFIYHVCLVCMWVAIENVLCGTISYHFNLFIIFQLDRVLALHLLHRLVIHLLLALLLIPFKLELFLQLFHQVWFFILSGSLIWPIMTRLQSLRHSTRHMFWTALLFCLELHTIANLLSHGVTEHRFAVQGNFWLGALFTELGSWEILLILFGWGSAGLQIYVLVGFRGHLLWTWFCSKSWGDLPIQLLCCLICL